MPCMHLALLGAGLVRSPRRSPCARRPAAACAFRAARAARPPPRLPRPPPPGACYPDPACCRCPCGRTRRGVATRRPPRRRRKVRRRRVRHVELPQKAHGGFPLVVPITQLAGAYGRRSCRSSIKKPPGGGRPNLYGAGVLATENGSQGALAGASHYFLGERVHVLAAALATRLEPRLPRPSAALGEDPRVDESRRWRACSARTCSSGARRSARGCALMDAEFEVPLRSRGRDRAPGVGFTVSTAGGRLPLDWLRRCRRRCSTTTATTSSRPRAASFYGAPTSPVLGGARRDGRLRDGPSWTNLLYRPLVPERVFLCADPYVAQSVGDPPFYLQPYAQPFGAPPCALAGPRGAGALRARCGGSSPRAGASSA